MHTRISMRSGEGKTGEGPREKTPKRKASYRAYKNEEIFVTLDHNKENELIVPRFGFIESGAWLELLCH